MMSSRILSLIVRIEEAIKTYPFSIIKLNGMGKKKIEEFFGAIINAAVSSVQIDKQGV